MPKKGFNWRARQVVDTLIDDSFTKKIQVELDENQTNYDSCNALVLPSQKRQTKVKKTAESTTKILSNKQRKKLEKIVEKKTKKENRSSLLEYLSKYQATPEELSLLTSISTVQTKGVKKFNSDVVDKPKVLNIAYEAKISAISGSKRKRTALLNNNKKIKTDDPNVIDKESSDEEETEDEESSDENQPQLSEDNVKNDKVTNVEENTDSKIETQVLDVKNDSVKEIDNTVSNVEMEKEKYIKKGKLKKVKTPINYEVHKTVFVPVHRKSEIQKARLKLPILAEEQEITEAINENPIVVIAGETGSGKTTQVPQFLYEAGYAVSSSIAVTEPRRVAAIAMSRRVGEEMNLTSKNVSYLIRFEGNVTDHTKIKFMTDGVLLKEIQSDFLLSKYSVVILDEAHERSVYTDILIGLLSRIVPLRYKNGKPLKLIIMSATLRLEDFTDNARLFKKPPPVIKVDARQFPVTIHFNKRTNDNYIREAFNKAVKIHSKLPEGGILIFVSGQQEVNRLVKRLRKTFPIKNKHKIAREENIQDSDSDSELELERRTKKNFRKKTKLNLPNINLDDYALPGVEEDLSDQMNSEEEEIESDSEPDIEDLNNCQPMWALPLYSLLPTDKQQRVFEAPPPGCRLCVVSTNVAETSLTIPNIKYVVDTGKSKVKLYDRVTGVSNYQVGWTSKASANQRAGRAGRIAPGHCYRLYSSALFNDEFKEFSIPEIQQKPVDDLYLQMKCMNIDKVVNFPFPTAPDLIQLKTAETRLEILGAIKESHVTELGKAIAKFPVLPRFGKMLALSHQHNLLPYTICIVAALSVQEVLLETPIFTNVEETKLIRQKWAGIRRQWAGHGQSLLLGDPLVLLKAVGAAEYANIENNLEKFCNDNGLRQKAVIEIRKLRIQLTNSINLNVQDCEVDVDPKLTPPNATQCKFLRQIILSGMGDQVAKKITDDEIRDDEDKKKYKYAYRSTNMEDPIFLHSGSVLRKTMPDFVVYQEVYETNKMYMRGVTAIEPEWLPTYVPHLCNMSPPLTIPEPFFKNGTVYCMVTGTFGEQAFKLPLCEMAYPKCAELYKYFGKLLLEGKVFIKLEKYTFFLESSTGSMIKSWARIHPRTVMLLKALLKRDVHTKNSLEEIWEEHPRYLLKEYLMWLPESMHNEVELMWPPLDQTSNDLSIH